MRHVSLLIILTNTFLCSMDKQVTQIDPNSQKKRWKQSIAVVRREPSLLKLGEKRERKEHHGRKRSISNPTKPDAVIVNFDAWEIPNNNDNHKRQLEPTKDKSSLLLNTLQIKKSKKVGTKHRQTPSGSFTEGVTNRYVRPPRIPPQQKKKLLSLIEQKHIKPPHLKTKSQSEGDLKETLSKYTSPKKGSNNLTVSNQEEEKGGLEDQKQPHPVWFEEAHKLFPTVASLVLQANSKNNVNESEIKILAVLKNIMTEPKKLYYIHEISQKSTNVILSFESLLTPRTNFLNKTEEYNELIRLIMLYRIESTEYRKQVEVYTAKIDGCNEELDQLRKTVATLNIKQDAFRQSLTIMRNNNQKKSEPPNERPPDQESSKKSRIKSPRGSKDKVNRRTSKERKRT